ncbi:ABC transporter substrate-binding protein [Enterococcus sp. LJL128]
MTKIRLYQNKTNPLVLPIVLADRLGYFDRYQTVVDLELAESFQFHSNKSFVDNEVDGVMGDLTFFFDYLKQGKEAVVTSTLTRTIQLIGYPEALKKRGLRVGAARKGLFPFFMDYDLKEMLEDPEIVWIDNTYERINALENKEIDALVAIEPFITQIRKLLPTAVFWDSAASDKTMVMWCFDKAFYQKNPLLVKNFHLALEAAAADFNQLSPDEKIRQCLEVADYSQEAAEEMVHFMFEPQKNYSVRDFELLANWLAEDGQLAESLKGKDYIAQIYTE